MWSPLDHDKRAGDGSSASAVGRSATAGAVGAAVRERALPAAVVVGGAALMAALETPVACCAPLGAPALERRRRGDGGAVQGAR